MIAATSPIDRVIAKLPDAKRSGSGWVARCPAHDDRNASLSITEGDDGRVLLHCHAGCTTAEVVAAMGLEVSDLFVQDDRRNGHRKPSTKKAKLGPIVAEYIYRDAAGAIAFRVTRHDPKDFRQWKPDGKNGWIAKSHPQPRPIYRLPHVHTASADAFVFVVEGEKDADRLANEGLVATTIAGGAEKAHTADLTPLHGRDVMILPDNDDSGRKHAHKLAKLLDGEAASLRVLALEGLPAKGDVSDWLDAGNDAEGLVTLAEKAPAWEPKQSDKFTFYTASEFDGLDLRRDYHIPHILAAGPVPTVLAGSFKTLKTSVAIDLLLSLATGSRFLNHYAVTKPINVAMMSGESGGFALQSLARRILHSRGWTMAGVGGRFRICSDVLNLAKADDLDEVERFVIEHDIKVFAIDPTYLAMRGLRNDDAGSIFAMASVLEPLARLGERTGCTPLIVHHNSRAATRANPGEPAELADIAWSGFAEWAGQWLLLSRREKYNPDSDGEHLLWLSAGGRDGHSALVGVNVWEGRQDDPSGRRWQVEVEQASHTRQATAQAEQDRREQRSEARKRAQLEADIEAVIGALKQMPEGETRTGIRDRAGLSGAKFNPALAVLIGDGRVVEVEITKANGRKYDGFQLHPDAPGRIGTDSESSGCPGHTSQQRDTTPLRGCPGPAVCDREDPGDEQGELLKPNLSGCGGEA